jgi:ribonuclease T2
MEPLPQVNFRFVLFWRREPALRRFPIFRRVSSAALVITLLFLLFSTANAQDRRQGVPGQFDFYILSLSWSPSYCEAAAEERSRHRSNDRQCSGRRFAFVVHGLWPQYERGFPSYCQVPAPRLARVIADDMLDLMPSPHLVFHEWDRHGTCAGLSPRAYFDRVRTARAAVNIPDNYAHVDRPLIVAPGDVVDAFVKANPRLARDAIGVSCDNRRLMEIRICMSKDLSFRSCPDVTRHSCRRNKVVMPAVR